MDERESEVIALFFTACGILLDWWAVGQFASKEIVIDLLLLIGAEFVVGFLVVFMLQAFLEHTWEWQVSAAIWSAIVLTFGFAALAISAMV